MEQTQSKAGNYHSHLITYKVTKTWERIHSVDTFKRILMQCFKCTLFSFCIKTSFLYMGEKWTFCDMMICRDTVLLQQLWMSHGGAVRSDMRSMFAHLPWATSWQLAYRQCVSKFYSLSRPDYDDVIWALKDQVLSDSGDPCQSAFLLDQTGATYMLVS